MGKIPQKNCTLSPRQEFTIFTLFIVHKMCQKNNICLDLKNIYVILDYYKVNPICILVLSTRMIHTNKEILHF